MRIGVLRSVRLANVLHPSFAVRPVAFVAPRDAAPFASVVHYAAIPFLAAASFGYRVLLFTFDRDLFRTVEVLREGKLGFGEVAAARHGCHSEGDANALHSAEEGNMRKVLAGSVATMRRCYPRSWSGRPPARGSSLFRWGSSLCSF